MTQSPSGKKLSDYPQPSVTVDVLVFTVKDDKLQVALIKRGVEPFKEMWAIPGGFVRMDESLEDGARREIEEETGLTGVFLEQLYTYGDPERDPRGRVITVAYYALVPGEQLALKADTDAADASWFPVSEVPKLGFDHSKILQDALERLKGKLEYTNVAYALLPTRFRLSELQRVYEVILGEELDKRNFRKKILSLGLIEATDKYSSGAHRPAQLFRWKKRKMVWVK
jgi:8-oxo-dGTP diphosphatase